MQSNAMEQVLKFIDKVNISTQLMKGVDLEIIAEHYNTTVLKVQHISENKQAIMECFLYYIKSQDLPLRSGNYPRMENVLFCWLNDRNNVSNVALGRKALEIVEFLNEEPIRNTPTFTGSNYWANSFKMRYNIPVSRRKSTSVTMVDQHVNVYDEDSNFNLTSRAVPLQTSEHEDVVYSLKDQNEDKSDDEINAEVLQIQGATGEIVGDIENDCVGAACDNDQINCGGDESQRINRHDAIEVNPSASSVITIDLLDEVSTSQRDDDDATDESMETLKPENRKQPAITDDSSSGSGSSNAKRRKVSENVRTKNGLQPVSFKKYKEKKVIRTLKRLLKYVKDTDWPVEDRNDLNRLYQKSRFRLKKIS